MDKNRLTLGRGGATTRKGVQPLVCLRACPVLELGLQVSFSEQACMKPCRDSLGKKPAPPSPLRSCHEVSRQSGPWRTFLGSKGLPVTWPHSPCPQQEELQRLPVQAGILPG